MAEEPPKEEIKQSHGEEVEEEDNGLSTADTYVQIFLIQVEIHKATNLEKADIIGASDPYCRVTAFRQTYTTKTILKTLNPVWDEKTQFIFFKDPKELFFQIWDWDKGTKHDKIGDYTFSLEGFFDKNHSGFSGPLQLQHVKKGELHVTIKCQKLLPIEMENRAFQLQQLEKEQHQTIAEQNTNTETLTKEKSSLSQANQELQRNINELTDTNKDIENKFPTLKKRVQTLEEEKKNLSNVQTNTQKEMENMQNQLTTVKTTLSNAQEAVEDLRKENEEYNTNIKGVNSQMAKLEQDIAKKNNEIEKEKEKQNKKKKENIQVAVVPPSSSEDLDNKPTTPLLNRNAESSKCQCCLLM